MGSRNSRLTIKKVKDSMKKIALLLLTMFSFVAYVNAADTVMIASGQTITNSRYAPINVRWVWTNVASTAAQSDTFAADLNKRIWGPYELTKLGGSGPMAAGFQIYADAVGGSDDTLIGSYQLLPAFGTTVPTFADTTSANWTTACTTISATGVNKYIDLTSKAGSFLVWRWMARSVSAVCQSGNAGLGFKEDATSYRELK
jgi:hypothetical protein